MRPEYSCHQSDTIEVSKLGQAEIVMWAYDAGRISQREVDSTHEVRRDTDVHPARPKVSSTNEPNAATSAYDSFLDVTVLHGLVRYHILIVIDLASRRVEIGGIMHEPTGAWMMQVVRNLLDAEDGFLTGKTKLIMDRDPVFTSDVRTLLQSGSVETVRLPARSPNLNAFAERFVLSIKSECLDQLILLGEGHLRMAVREYVAHYNFERPHQGLDGRFVMPANENGAGQIECRELLGGLLRYYHREAA